MSKVIFSLLVFIFATTQLRADVVKVCDTTISFEGRGSQITMTVKKDLNNGLSGTVEGSGGEKLIYEKVENPSYTVREGLSSDMFESDEIENLNDGELFIVHALAMEIYMTSGIKLEDVRSITIYKFLEEGVNIGMTAFAEASDQDGDVMGLFMGGFFISPCK